MKETPLDIVICIGDNHLKIAEKTIACLIKHFEFHRILIISSSSLINVLREKLLTQDNIIFIDENTLIPEISLSTLEQYFIRHNAQRKRAGWYYQQFLKMQAAYYCQTPHYLIWDADTVPLRTIHFFEEEKVLIHHSKEYHPPYFDTLYRLLRIKKQISPSFITEHMVINTAVMQSLIHTIQEKNREQSWCFTVLDHIEKQHLSHSGFSEYETYGSYVVHQQAKDFILRSDSYSLKTLRHGSRLFSAHPTTIDLNILKALDYDYVTFEVWDQQRPKKIFKNKILSWGFYLSSLLKLKSLSAAILKQFQKRIR